MEALQIVVCLFAENSWYYCLADNLWIWQRESKVALVVETLSFNSLFKM